MLKIELETISSQFGNLINRMVLSLGKIPMPVLIFFILMSVFGTYIPRPNEEQYLALSKFFLDPDWVPKAHNLNEFPGTRLFYQLLTGSLLKYFSFEATVLIGRTALAVLFSYSLACFYRALDFNRIMILLQLPILFFMRQSYFGGSWIFLGMEAKSFSYVFVFLAMSAFAKERWTRMIVFSVLASYFHLLVGGFSFLYLFACMFLFDKNIAFKEQFKLAALFTISLLPMIIYMKSALGSTGESIPNPEWIYTYFRNAHHTVIYRDWGYFSGLHARGVFASFVSMLILFAAYHKLKSARIKKVCQFAIVSFLGSLILIFIGAFDSKGVLLKFYLYRINALSVFTSYMVFTYILFKAVKEDYKPILNLLILVLAIFFIQRKANSNFRQMLKYESSKDQSYHEICADITALTDSEDIILYLTKDNQFDGQLDFIRRTKRDRFVVHKFVPAQMNKLPEWYDRLQKRQHIFKDIKKLSEVKKKYKIDYILAKRTYKNLELVTERHPYKLYKVD